MKFHAPEMESCSEIDISYRDRVQILPAIFTYWTNIYLFDILITEIVWTKRCTPCYNSFHVYLIKMVFVHACKFLKQFRKKNHKIATTYADNMWYVS